MAYASRVGRARVSSKKPQALGVCDRCSLWYNLIDLQFQYEWRGTTLQNIWIRVCDRCLDVPQEQLRAIVLPADPTPVWQPRVEQFEELETNYRTTLPPVIDPVSGLQRPVSTKRITQDFQFRITQPIGRPDGLIQNGVMPFNGANQKHYGVRLNPLSLTANGTATITATFSAAHGLSTNDQIAVEGLTNPLATGFYSVVVSNPMVFTYQTASNIVTGALLTGTTLMVTCLVGLPYGSVRIPQVGP
jgi:hypothetical protein